MELRESKTEKFAEELYFLMMSSAMKDRVKTLGAKYGFSVKALRDEIMSAGNSVGGRIEISRQETDYCPTKEAVWNN